MKDKSNDINILKKNLKKIPYENTKLLLDTFPYVMSPWDHWNALIKILTDKNEEEDKNTNTFHEVNSKNNDKITTQKHVIFLKKESDDGYISESYISDMSDCDDIDDEDADADDIISILKWDGE